MTHATTHETEAWRAAVRVQGVLSRLKYRDNVTFRCQPQMSAVTVDAVLRAPDSRAIHDPSRPAVPAQVGMAYTFPIWRLDDMDDYDVAVHIWRCLIEPMERHEAAEWFRLDGELVVDPHDPTSAF